MPIQEKYHFNANKQHSCAKWFILIIGKPHSQINYIQTHFPHVLITVKGDQLQSQNTSIQNLIISHSLSGAGDIQNSQTRPLETDVASVCKGTTWM